MKCITYTSILLKKLGQWNMPLYLCKKKKKKIKNICYCISREKLWLTKSSPSLYENDFKMNSFQPIKRWEVLKQRLISAVMSICIHRMVQFYCDNSLHDIPTVMCEKIMSIAFYPGKLLQNERFKNGQNKPI